MRRGSQDHWFQVLPNLAGEPSRTDIGATLAGGPEKVITMMFRIAFASVVLGSLTVSLPAAPPAPRVFTGRVKDIRGTDGTLARTIGEGKRLTDRAFLITEARIVGPGGAEWKVEALRPGDLVEVEMALQGELVQEIRVLPDRKNR
jgi:hypothetical protein